MAEVVLIMGPSGSGKSRSIMTLDPKETFLINSLGKKLPFRGSGVMYTPYVREKNTGNMLKTNNSLRVIQALNVINKELPHIKNVVIDDNTHQSSMEFLRRINESSWNKFNDIASNMVGIVETAKNLREDLVVYILHHTRSRGDGVTEDKKTEAMTLGKLVDEKLSSYESFFTMVLLAAKEKTDDGISYCFYTADPDSTAKSPEGMFESNKIPNDLALVRKSMECYYNDEDCK